MSYQHLSLAERYYIEIERKMKVSINQISKAPGRSQSSISRELQRNHGQRGYRLNKPIVLLKSGKRTKATPLN